MVGYRMVERVLELPAMAGQPLRIELTPAPIELEGVTVDGDRSTWLAHLETFKTLFLGATPNATACTLLNPEVLSFVARGDSVFRAVASGPLRVENRALGYRVDFYIDRFVARGPLDRHQLARQVAGQFHPLPPADAAERERWAASRRRAYNGSLRHFGHALQEGRLHEAGFRLYRSDEMSFARDEGAPVARRSAPASDDAARVRRANKRVSNPSALIHSEEGNGQFVLAPGDARYLRVDYLNEDTPRAYVQQQFSDFVGLTTRKSFALDKQVSWLDFQGRPAVLDAETGAFVPPFVPTLRGYWGWAGRGADLLPRGYRPQ
jgi:hypothetical protein